MILLWYHYNVTPKPIPTPTYRSVGYVAYCGGMVWCSFAAYTLAYRMARCSLAAYTLAYRMARCSLAAKGGEDGYYRKIHVKASGAL